MGHIQHRLSLVVLFSSIILKLLLQLLNTSKYFQYFINSLAINISYIHLSKLKYFTSDEI
ncbi:MAG: hypothetical protein WCG25_04255 [bacterium]